MSGSDSSETDVRDKLRPMVDELSAGRRVGDDAFDRVYPPRIRRLSAEFWTPVDVAVRAAALLTEGFPRARVLDVGAGVGKLCAIGALTTEATFTGVEHRSGLVEVGRRALAMLGASRATIVEGTLDEIEWLEHDAYYFYNPFEENIFMSDDRVDDSVELSDERYERDIARAERALDEAPLGTRVVTYHGFGGRVPFTYEQAHAERAGTGWLRAWVKTRRGSSAHRGRLEAGIRGINLI